MADPKKYYAKKEVVDSYDADRFNAIGGKCVDSIQKNIVLKYLAKGALIADVGAGTGRFSLFLAQKGFKVTSIDYSQNMLKILQERAKKSKLNISTIRADITKIFQAKKFDAIVSVHVLMHINEWEKVIDNISRLLKPNGLAIIEFPHKGGTSIFGRAIRKFLCAVKSSSQWTKTNPQVFSKQELICAFEENNMSVQEFAMCFSIPQTVYRYCPKLLLPVVKIIDRAVLNTPLKNFAANMFVVARKNG